MKSKFSVIFVFLFIRLCHQQNRVCLTEVIRSLGFHGRLTPNNTNSLCPKVLFNCCTKHDQMKMHKLWNKRTSFVLNAYYKGSIQEFAKVRVVIN